MMKQSVVAGEFLIQRLQFKEEIFVKERKSKKFVSVISHKEDEEVPLFH